MTPRQFTRGLRAAVARFKSEQAQSSAPRAFYAAKKKIVCQHCDSGLFLKSQGDSGVMFSGDLIIPSGGPGLYALVCVTCGRLEFFAVEPTADETGPLHGS